MNKSTLELIDNLKDVANQLAADKKFAEARELFQIIKDAKKESKKDKETTNECEKCGIEISKGSKLCKKCRRKKKNAALVQLYCVASTLDEIGEEESSTKVDEIIADMDKESEISDLIEDLNEIREEFNEKLDELREEFEELKEEEEEEKEEEDEDAEEEEEDEEEEDDEDEDKEEEEEEDKEEVPFVEEILERVEPESKGEVQVLLSALTNFLQKNAIKISPKLRKKIDQLSKPARKKWIKVYKKALEYARKHKDEIEGTPEEYAARTAWDETEEEEKGKEKKAGFSLSDFDLIKEGKMKTKKCPKCGTKVLATSGYCVKCKKKVFEPEKKKKKEEEE